MKISILTPSYNQGPYIEKCIESVLAQGYPDFEHIVVDGGSKDETVRVLKKYDHLVWVSEPDNGQADALGKALAMASGDIIGWINSDDYYLPGAFHRVASCFDDDSLDWVVGNLVYVSSGGSVSKRISPRVTYDELLINPDIVKQPPTFFRRSALEKAGGFNAKLHMVMDYDLWLRLAKSSAPMHVQDYFACFLLHEHQKTSGKYVWRQLLEILGVLRAEGAPWGSIVRAIVPKAVIAGKITLKNMLGL